LSYGQWTAWGILGAQTAAPCGIVQRRLPADLPNITARTRPSLPSLNCSPAPISTLTVRYGKPQRSRMACSVCPFGGAGE